MPHLIVEYSRNLKTSVDPDAFVRTLHDAVTAMGIFSPMTLRTRAVERECYCVGDGHPDNGFVHIVLRIRPGRDPEDKRRLGQDIFAAIERYLAPVFRAHPVGLTFEIQEIDTESRFLRSNLAEHRAAANQNDQ